VQNFTFDYGQTPKAATFSQPSSKLSNIIFSLTLVRRAIKKLKVNTAADPDGIPRILFIKCLDELCYPISLLFTLSFESGILPAAWLMSYITPIFKKRNPSFANNYRPIALTAIMYKLMETIIKDQMVQILSDKGLINKRQHAFIKIKKTLHG
jgi:hypothetical protein